MRKILLSLAFVVVSSFVFANSHSEVSDSLTHEGIKQSPVSMVVKINGGYSKIMKELQSMKELENFNDINLKEFTVKFSVDVNDTDTNEKSEVQVSITSPTHVETIDRAIALLKKK